MSERAEDDRAAVAAVVRAFFDAFTSGPELEKRLDALPGLFVPGAVVVRTCGGAPTVYDVPGFVAPRRALLTAGEVTGFREWEVDGRTELLGDVAHHVCTYAKRWSQDGVEHTGRGAKSLQLVRTGAVWRLSAVAWDDERPGWSPPEDLPTSARP